MSGSLDGKTFLLGVGAQKAGTTWLYDYLAQRKEVYISPLKEIHYFDTKHRPDLCIGADQLYIDKLAALQRRWILPGSSKAVRLKHMRERIRMISDDTAYVDYFERHVPASCSLFGEITPSYSLLRRDGFEDIARRFERIKIVFLLRDPVERFRSQLRMEMRWADPGRSEEELFVEALDQPSFLERTWYHETIGALRSVFAPEQIYIGFFDNFFSDGEIARLCDFLGIPFMPGAYRKKSNAAPKGTGLDPRLKALARQRFAPVYDFCKAEFGDRLPLAWGV
ncbi:MAG: sulfotransferase [Parvibaculum sp.]